jgi:hypothetical protein
MGAAPAPAADFAATEGQAWTPIKAAPGQIAGAIEAGPNAPSVRYADSSPAGGGASCAQLLPREAGEVATPPHCGGASQDSPGRNATRWRASAETEGAL